MRDDFFVCFLYLHMEFVHAATETDLMRMIHFLLHHCYYAEERSNHLMQRNGINSGRLMPFFANSQFSLSSHNFMAGKNVFF